MASSSDHNQQVEDLFAAAIALPIAKRERFVMDAAGADTALAREVLELVTADSEAGDLGLEATPRPDASAGDRVGSYRLVRLLGVGGMGTVWLAERDDDVYDAQVAIKLIKRGMESAETLRRFKQERELLASLEHPNIARILDGGVTADGRPYMVMEYVAGQTIDVFCRDRSLGVRARLELFFAVCQAVQHAHNNLVVHRDLKPSNILVNEAGEPKLLDFGIAKLLDPGQGPDETIAVHRVLSPRYASPEQVRGDIITTASDVYSLGLVLYEILTGESPYPTGEDSVQAVQRHVLEHEPLRPSVAVVTRNTRRKLPKNQVRTLQRRLSGDVDTIILKALQKGPERRYSSVDGLAADIRRHLDGLPVLARADSLGYRTIRFIQRNALAVGAAMVIGVVLAAATVTSSSLFFRARQAQQDAAAERVVAERVSGFLQDMLSSIDPQIARGRDTELLSELLDQASGRIDDELGETPRVAAALYHTLGMTKLTLAENESGEKFLRQAVDLQRVRLEQAGPGNAGNHADLIISLRDLGYAIHKSGRYAEAEAVLREALQLAESHLDVNESDLAMTRFHLGTTLEASGSYDEAENQLRQAVATLRQNGSASQRIETLNGLGSYVMYNQQEYAEAESLFVEALTLARTEPAAGALAEAGCLQSLATVKRHQGQNVKAEAHYRQALDSAVAMLPVQHPVLANWKSQLATLLENEKRYDEAELLYREALSAQREVLGDDHRNVGTTANNLAGALRKAGRYVDAAPHYAEAVRIYRAALGEDHAWVAIVLANQAYNQFLANDFAQAEQTAQQCLQVSAGHWPPEHWRIAMVETMVGGCLTARGDFRAAESLLTDSLSKLENGEGSPPPRIRMAREQLAELYRRWDKPEQAAAYEALLKD